MTLNEAIAEIKKVSQNTLSDGDIRALVGCSPTELVRMILRHVDAHAALRSREVWWTISALQAQVPSWVPTAENMGRALALLHGTLSA